MPTWHTYRSWLLLLQQRDYRCAVEVCGDVVTPGSVKETFFFDRRYERGSDWYARHFRRGAATSDRVIAVASSYFHHPDVPARVLRHLGTIPRGCTVRDQADRRVSMYLPRRSYGLKMIDCRDAARQHPEIIETAVLWTALERQAAPADGRRARVGDRTTRRPDRRRSGTAASGHVALEDGSNSNEPSAADTVAPITPEGIR